MTRHRSKQHTITRVASTVAALLVTCGLAWQMLAPDYMSWRYLQRVMVHGDSEVTDWQTVFPSRAITNDPAHISALPFAPSGQLTKLWSSIKYVKDGNATSIGPDMQAFLTGSDTNSFVVVKDGQIVYETYLDGTNQDTLHASMSVAKSYVSALTGIAIHEGYIGSVDDPVVKYLPELAGKVSKDMTIKHLLTMSAGNAYDGAGGLTGDDTKTYWSDNIRALVLKYFRTAKAPGTDMDYNDYLPQVLGMILEKTTNMSLSQYMQEKIWKPAGMEAPGSWSLDSQQTGFEQSAVGVNARSRDFARFGLLYLNKGVWNGQQIIPEAWVTESTNTKQQGSDYYPAGGPTGSKAYGYYWWGHKKADGTYDYYARGKHGQFIYVAPASNVVIVRTGSSIGHIQDWPLLLQQIADLTK